MFARLLRKLGHTQDSVNPFVLAGVALLTIQVLHRLHTTGFDRKIAAADTLQLASHGEGFRDAGGRDDWAPLAVAGFCLEDNGKSRASLDHSLLKRKWFLHDVLTSRHAANPSVLHGFGS